MTENQIRTNTNKFINGHWYGEGVMEASSKTIKVALTINENVLLSIFINGKLERVTPFSSTAHWVEQFLSFMDNQKFFIKCANEKEIVFGELVKPGKFKGGVRWVLTFKRVA